MQKILLLILFNFVTTIALANTPENIAVNVDFYFKQHNKNGRVIQYFLKNKVNMLTNNHEWTVIQSDQISSNGRFILLGKLDDANSKHAVLSFLVVDNDNKKPGIVAKPKLIVPYGKKGEIALTNKNEKFQLTILANTLNA